jgi:LPXTG-motif cell wall-anchored protein
MTTTILSIIGSVLLIVIGGWKYLKRKNDYKIQQAERARRELEDANKTGNPSDFLDSFGRLR